MSVIAKVEDAIIAALKPAFTKDGRLLVQDIGSIPGTFSRPILERLLQHAPGCYVAFINGTGTQIDGAYMDARFDVFAVTDHVSELERRAGNDMQIGGYQIIEIVAATINDLTVVDIGTLRFKGVKNLFNESTFDMGASIYAASFELPNMEMPSTVNPDTLKDFITFHVDYDIEPYAGSQQQVAWSNEDHNNAPDAHDEVKPEQ